jgi:hypothetical protein
MESMVMHLEKLVPASMLLRLTPSITLETLKSG